MTAPSLTLTPAPQSTEGPTAILAAAESLLTAFTATVEQVNAAGEDGAVKKLADAMAEVLRAVAKRVEAA